MLSPLGVTLLPFWVSLYADDDVMFVAPKLDDPLKGAMELFGLASGLFSILDKSVATPIGCIEQELHLVCDSLSCKVELFP